MHSHRSFGPGPAPRLSIGAPAPTPLRVLLQTCLLAMAATAAIAALYLGKSALGIDLMTGPSPLHHLLYPLLGRG